MFLFLHLEFHFDSLHNSAIKKLRATAQKTKNSTNSAYFCPISVFVQYQIVIRPHDEYDGVWLRFLHYLICKHTVCSETLYHETLNHHMFTLLFSWQRENWKFCSRSRRTELHLNEDPIGEVPQSDGAIFWARVGLQRKRRRHNKRDERW